MAKRHSDTKIWNKIYFRKAPSRVKLLWMYVKDNCDYAGFWEEDWEQASLSIGERVSERDFESFPELFAGRIEKVKPGLWWLPSFVEFHYGTTLKPKSKMHQSVIAALTKNGLQGRIKIADEVTSRAGKTKYAENVYLSEVEFSQVVARVGSKEGAMKCVEILDNYKGSKGKKYESDYRAILNWVIDEFKKRLGDGRIRLNIARYYTCPQCHQEVLESQRYHHWQQGVCPAYKLAGPDVVRQVREDLLKLNDQVKVK